MLAYREIIDSNKLRSVVKLPLAFKDKEVEIIVLPVKSKEQKRKKLSQDWANALKDQKEKYTSLELQKKALDWRGD